MYVIEFSMNFYVIKFFLLKKTTLIQLYCSPQWFYPWKSMEQTGQDNMRTALSGPKGPEITDDDVWKWHTTTSLGIFSPILHKFISKECEPIFKY